MVTINVISSEAVGAVKIMSNYGFVALKNPGGDFSWSKKNYGVWGTPTSFLVDPEGKIIFNLTGLESLDSEKLCDQEVAGLLEWSASGNSVHATAPSSKAQP